LPAASSHISGIQAGLAAGAGGEWAPAILPNWSFKVEYLYVDLGRTTLSATGTPFFISTCCVAPVFTATHSEQTQFHSVRVGGSYHFN
jgi:outer membrane immunogenic protein